MEAPCFAEKGFFDLPFVEVMMACPNTFLYVSNLGARVNDTKYILPSSLLPMMYSRSSVHSRK